MNVSMQVPSNSFKATEAVKNEAQEQQDLKNKPVRSFGGTLGALALSGLVNGVAPYPIQKVGIDNLKKYGNFDAEEGKVIHNAIKDMHIQAGLKDKGVRIRFLNKELKRKADYFIDKKNGKISDTFMKDLIDFMNVDTTRTGNNAFFLSKDLKLPKITYSEYLKLVETKGKAYAEQKLKEKATYIKGNSVLLSKEGLHSAGFHELGHAMNANLSKFGRILQKSRPVSMFVPLLLGLYGACTRKAKPKNEDGKLNGAQKTHNFVRNNAGKLAFLASVPMLLEEGMATVKGQKFANKLLKPELAKRVLKANIWAYTTYLSMGIFGALAAATAVKVKDAAIAKKETRLTAIAEATKDED